MIKVSVLYPNKPGSHFDMNYYINQHMPLAMRLLKKGLRKTEADAGIQGAAPGAPAEFYGGCQFYFDTIEAFAEVWGPAAKVAPINHFLIYFTSRDPFWLLS